MIRRRRTLDRMDLERIELDALDLIVSHGGDLDAIEAVVLNRYQDDQEAFTAAVYVTTYMNVYRRPGGPKMIRELRDELAARQPEPARPRRRRWRVA